MGWDYKPYVSVAARRAQADKAAKKAAKAGHAWSPVTVQGRSIAKTFWGKAWCDNLEAYSDFENRLPRGRTYVRNGSVVDLQIQPGKITARVTGSELYQIVIDITALPKAQWQALVQDCTGSIATLVELLQGKLSQAVMERMCKPQTGMFPAPRQIKMACSCPDWAGMCKHVAATLYGVGTRLDEEPQLLFTLRQVDAGDPTLADVFGLDMAVADAPAEATTDKPMSAKRAKKAVVEKAAAPAARKAAVKKPAAKKAVAKKAALPAAKKAVAKKAATGKPAAKKVSAL